MQLPIMYLYPRTGSNNGAYTCYEWVLWELQNHLCVVDDILNVWIEVWYIVVLALVDFNRAFDIIHHKLLLWILHFVGLSTLGSYAQLLIWSPLPTSLLCRQHRNICTSLFSVLYCITYIPLYLHMYVFIRSSVL